MTTTLDEDTLYIRSSQYRLWSFLPSTVTSNRSTANKSTSERLLKRRKLRRDSQAASPSSASLNLNAAEPLDPEEELSVLTQHYIPLIAQILGTFFPQIAAFENVQNSAAQYLRRFYLNRSIMDPLGLTLSTSPSNASQPASAPAFTSNTPAPFTLDNPTTLLLASIYLSTKIHDAFLPLDQFVQRLHDKGARKEEPANRFEGIEGLTVELIKKAEQILTRGLRFAFEVRHPGDGIAGVEMEICGILREEANTASAADGANGAGHDERARRRKLRDELLALAAPDEHEAEGTRITKGTARLKTALQKTKKILHSAAHASDVYFHFTPSQILLAALSLADSALADVYLHWKLRLDSPDADGAAAEVAQKIVTTIRRCSALLAAAAERAEPSQLAPLLVRLRAVHALLSVPAPVPVNSTGAGADAGMQEDSDAAPSVKRGFDSSDEEEEDVVSGVGKKKKRRRIEDDDVFGGPLKASE